MKSQAVNNLLQLAKALDVTPEYLLIGDNNIDKLHGGN